MHTMQCRGSLMCDHNYSLSKVEAFYNNLSGERKKHVGIMST